MQELKRIVADLMKTDADTLDGSTVLSGLLASSMGRARLDAVLRRDLGLAHPAVYTVKTFGELARLAGMESTGGSASANAARPSLPSSAPSGAVTLGIDMQSVDALPETQDFWEDSFYRQHFTPREIAYALLQSSPRESLAGAWCAKEALRKADSRWMGVDWQGTEVVHDALGRPSLQSGEETLPCAVSLTHTGGFALAAVAFVEAPQPLPAVVPAPVSESAPPSKAKASPLPLLVALLALLISLAVAVSVLRH